MYSNQHGRFTSPDPYGGSGFVNVPQSWNRYSYCLNRPFVFTDPLGLIWLTQNDNDYIWVDDKEYKKNSEKYKDYTVGNGAVIKLTSTTVEKAKDLVGSYVSLNSNGTISGVPDPTMNIAMGDPDEPMSRDDLVVMLGAVRSGGNLDELRGPPGGSRRFGTTQRFYDSDGYALLDLDTHSGHEEYGQPHGHWWTWDKDRIIGSRGDPDFAPEGTTETGKDENGQPVFDPWGRVMIPGPSGISPQVPIRPMPIRPGVPLRPIVPEFVFP